MTREVGQVAPVSVVIPCYNCAFSIERAVASVTSQTTRPGELILVDDASTDHTRDVIAEMQERYGADWLHVVVLERNEGPATARNAGWDAARYQYLAFLDADDSWHPKKLEIQWAFMNAHPEVHICAHGYFETDANRSSGATSVPTGYKILKRAQLLLTNRLATRTVMLKRSLGYRFAPGKRYAEDYLLWLQMACDGKTIALLEAKLAYAYKAAYGDSGLSGSLWRMERGELETYWQLKREGRLGTAAASLLTMWSLAKYCRRLLWVSLRATKHVAESR